MATGPQHRHDTRHVGLVPPAQLGTGTPDGTKFLRDDNAWELPAGVGGGIEITDGTHDITGATKLTVTGGTVGGSTPNATLTVSGGSSLGWVNVKDYGALGDNSHDDTSDITAAIADLPATGGCLYFPAGTYKITSTLSINKPGTLVLGDGSEYSGSVIHMTTANTTALVFNPSWDGTRDQTCLMRGIWVKGPSPRYGATSGYGISAASDLHLENCSVSAFYVGLYLYSATYYSRVYGCIFTDCASAGIYMVATNNCTVDTCRFIGAFSTTGDLGPMFYGIAIYCTSPYGLANRVINCSIEYFGGNGISLNGGRAVEITGNYFETQQSSSGHAHIDIGTGEWNYATLIASNYFQGDGVAGFNAISANKAQGVTILSNFFGINAAIGITSSGTNSSDFLLMGNEWTGTPTLTLPTSSYTLDPANPPAPAVTDIGNVPTAEMDPTKRLAPTGTGGVEWVTGSTSSGGELIISDAPSTPLIFGDLVQNDAQTDLLYTG